MKKLITLLLALAMILSLTACGEQPTGAAGDDGNTVSAESDGRTLYEAAIQLACDGDFPGSIEGLKRLWPLRKQIPGLGGTFISPISAWRSYTACWVIPRDRRRRTPIALPPAAWSRWASMIFTLRATVI